MLAVSLGDLLRTDSITWDRFELRGVSGLRFIFILLILQKVNFILFFLGKCYELLQSRIATVLHKKVNCLAFFVYVQFMSLYYVRMVELL